MKLRNWRNKRNLLKNNVRKSLIFLIKRIMLLMAWKRNLMAKENKNLILRKKIIRSGKNGKMPRKRDSTKLSKKSTKFKPRTTNFGTNSTSPNKLTGNKSTTLIGSNGKWKSKAEKWINSREKRETSNTKKKIKKEKNKKSFKNTSEKSNSVTIWSPIFIVWRKTSTNPIRIIRIWLNKLLMSGLNWPLILNGKRRRDCNSWNLRNPRKMRKLLRKVVKRIKIKIPSKRRNTFSTFHTTYKTNSNFWKS